MPTSCSHYFREAVAGAARAGVDTDALLAAVGLRRERIEDPAWRGDLTVLARLVQLIVEALDDEFMGYARARSTPGTFAMMTHCAIGEDSVEQAIQKGVLFYSLVTEAVQMSFDTHPGGGTWTVSLARPERDPEHYFVEFWLSIWFRLWSWLAGETPDLVAVELAHPAGAGNRDELALLFGRAPVFDAPRTSLTVDTAFLRRPLIRSRQDLKDFLGAAPLGVMTPLAERPDAARRVRAMVRVRGREPIEFPPFADLAARMYLTEKTLRRRLRAESTSYRAIKREIRQDVAERLLRETDAPVQEVSRLSGYSEPRAFIRAFGEWTGQSPTAFRQAPARPVR